MFLSLTFAHAETFRQGAARAVYPFKYTIPVKLAAATLDTLSNADYT
jgi:hypothetical protein